MDKKEQNRQAAFWYIAYIAVIFAGQSIALWFLFDTTYYLLGLMAVFVVMTLINYHYLSGGPDKSTNEFMDEVGRQQGRHPFMPFGRCVALCVPLALALAVNLLVQMGGA